jgi:ATP-dependent DNA ligase
MSVHRELDQRIKRVAATFAPSLPRKANTPPSGPGWIHEIKHDGFRILAQKDGDQVKLITRNGYDFADCCRLIVDAIANLSVKSCIIDDKAIVVDQNGLSVFDLIRRYRRHDMQLPCAPSTLSYQTAPTFGGRSTPMGVGILEATKFAFVPSEDNAREAH